MARKQIQSLFVILARPTPRARPDSCYLSEDGSTTTSKSRAARFWTYWDAKEFAKVHHITLDAVTYIGREEFTDFDREH